MLIKGLIKCFSKSDLKIKLESKLNEKEFREEILKPVLTDLGYEDIRILHGKNLASLISSRLGLEPPLPSSYY